MLRTHFEKVTVATYGRITNIPTIEVVIIDDTDNSEVTVGYLHPFRGYRFQVSGTPDGIGDYGSSEVIGLSHCLISDLREGFGSNSNRDNDGISKELLRGQAALAVLDFCTYSGRQAMMPEMNTTIFNTDTNKIDLFIDLCHAYLIENSGK